MGSALIDYTPPEAIAEYKDSNDMNAVRQIQTAILDTYSADFGKYRRSVPQLKLERVFDYASQTPCQKVRYSEISKEEQSRELKGAIDLLERARVLTRVFHTNYIATPLKNGINEKVFKFIFLDVGLAHASKNLSLVGRLNKGKIENQQLGQMAEQFVGQHLLQRGPTYP